MIIKKQLLNKEYKKCQIPVIEEDNMKDWGIRNKLKVELFPSCLGAFIHPSMSEIQKYKNGFIIIKKNLPNYKKLNIFFHEKKHHECYEKKCKCFLNDERHKQEEHAFLHSLEKSYDLDNIVLSYSMFNIIDSYLDFIDDVYESFTTPPENGCCSDFSFHGIAARNIMKSEFWEKCMEKIKKDKKALYYNFGERKNGVRSIIHYKKLIDRINKKSKFKDNREYIFKKIIKAIDQIKIRKGKIFT